MGIVQSLTAARMLAIEAASVVSGVVTGDDLILTRFDGTEINAGSVRGPQGDQGDPGAIGPAGVSLNRNYLHNNRFHINQGGWAETSTSSGTQNGPDRWQSASVFTAPSAFSMRLEETVPGELPESDKRYIKLITDGASQPQGDYALLQQRIEDVRTLSGETVTVSFWARVVDGPTKKISISFIQYFGTGSEFGTPSTSVPIPFGQVTVTTEWARYTVSGTIPSLANKIIGTQLNSYLAVRFWISAGSNHNGSIVPLGFQNDEFDFWGLQVEKGTVATPLVRRSDAEELQTCLRYYWFLGTGYGLDVTYPFTGWMGSLLGTATVGFFVQFPVMMRERPTLTYEGVTFIKPTGGAFVSGEFTSINGQHPGGVSAYSPVSGIVYEATSFAPSSGIAGLTAGQGVRITANSGLSFMAFDARI